MSTRIDVWQIGPDGKSVTPLDETMSEAGRTEPVDLQAWVRQAPELLGEPLLIIGEQVQTRSGPLDFLALDADGNTVVVELKRDTLARDALTQALDYASDVASWDVERLNSECRGFRDQPLEEALAAAFPDADLAELKLNGIQRILLVGTGTDAALERMVKWLSDGFGVPVNAVLFRYIRTHRGDELLAATRVIPEDLEREQRRWWSLELSDDPGAYDEETLTGLLRRYFAQANETPRRIRQVLLPLCLENDKVPRDLVKQRLIDQGETDNWGTAGRIATTISRELALLKNDFLRQIIRYDRAAPSWWRDHFRIAEEWRDLVVRLLDELSTSAAPGDDG